MPRIVVFQGSARNRHGEAHQWGKTRLFMEAAIDEARTLGASIDLIDLSVSEEGARVQPCYACISTAGGYHCHYPCDCYLRAGEMEAGEEGEEDEEGEEESPPDFLAENHIFERVEAADAFVVFTPANWYSVPTQVKAMFDRFVCANLTLTREDAAEVLGEENLKNPRVTRMFEKSGAADRLLRNHWEGKTAAFFIHGDYGADDYAKRREPRSLRIYRQSEDDQSIDVRGMVMPLVQQMRYSGVNVPDDLIVGMLINRGLDYATANDVAPKLTKPVEEARALMRRLMERITAPSEMSAYLNRFEVVAGTKR